ncbi:ABC transporter permease [Thalassiella azotivora]
MSVDTRLADTAAPSRRRRRLGVWVYVAVMAFVALSVTRAVTGQEVLTNTGTVQALVTLALPIALAGLGGLVAERAGVINIGLEGMMILGTWGAGFAGYQWGPWAALAGAVLGGVLGGVVHALATVTFGVDHIVSGVAINILAAGLVRFLSEISFSAGSGGGPTQSPSLASRGDSYALPVLSSGPDLLGRLESTDLVVLADAAGVLRGLTSDLTAFELIAIALIPAVGFLLWRTPLGLRWRSSGENPWAAESLGVRVSALRWLAVVVSGALAGLGGLFLVLFAGQYNEGQTGGRGFIGLAAMIFGNWRPGGLATGAALFGYADAIRLRDSSSQAVLALLLVIAIVLAVLAVRALRRARRLQGGLLAAGAVLAVTGWAALDSLPREVTTSTPYIVTLVVLATASQRLRPPKAVGSRFRRGEEH